jgi:hypothetical protein
LGLIEESPPNKRSSRKTFPVVSRSSNRGNCFRKGGSCNWSPRKIREEVATLFKASLPTQRSSGSLYPLEAQDSGYVKIGYTLGDWHKRKSEIKKQAHIEMDDNNEHALEDIPFAVLLFTPTCRNSSDISPTVPLKRSMSGSRSTLTWLRKPLIFGWEGWRFCWCILTWMLGSLVMMITRPAFT